MEGVGAFVGEEWESLNRMISIEDSVDLPDLMFNENYNDEIPSSIFSWPGNHDDQSLYNSPSFSDILVSGTSSTDTFNGSVNYHDTYGGYVHNATNYNTLNVDDQFMNNNLPVPDLQVYEDDQLCIINDQMQLKRKYNETVPNDETNHLSESPKKRSRVSKEKKKRKAESTTKKKKTTSMINNEQENNSSHEDESNGSEGSPSESKHDLITNSSPNSELGKRGSATDPQSLYARRRREKINERLRILQNLVPNGTKVDISTMLEEAVHYVKFLQLQIKLLSSDDMWMYAPIAHSGMDMGLYQKIFSNLPC